MKINVGLLTKVPGYLKALGTLRRAEAPAVLSAGVVALLAAATAPFVVMGKLSIGEANDALTAILLICGTVYGGALQLQAIWIKREERKAQEAKVQAEAIAEAATGEIQAIQTTIREATNVPLATDGEAPPGGKTQAAVKAAMTSAPVSAVRRAVQAAPARKRRPRNAQGFPGIRNI